MFARLPVQIVRQPDESSCGPTCLQAVYRYWGLDLPLERVLGEVHALDEGGTLGAFLGAHALGHGFEATIHSYNLQVFDPSWAGLDSNALRQKLAEQLKVKRRRKLEVATRAYDEFLAAGGRVDFQMIDLTLIRRYLSAGQPVIAGLSATYLYESKREIGDQYDDLRGEPAGHFVVLSGYDQQARRVQVSDPYPHPGSDQRSYEVSAARLVASVLLGVLTYDANLLVLRPRAAAAQARAEQT